ncbi:hypothetical protein [Sporosarcina sp. P18a]|nr:hypothetical protein [Sporosarcina sp. P18a]
MKETVTVSKWSYYLLILTLIFSTTIHAVNIVQAKPKVNIYIHDNRGGR